MAATHPQHSLQPGDSKRLDRLAFPSFAACLAAGLGSLVLALIVALIYQAIDGHGFTRLGYSYLVGFAYILSIALGCLFFVVVTFLFRAGWVVLVRRPAEVVAASFPILAVLFLPILIYVFTWTGVPYPWAQDLGHGGHGEHDAATHEEAPHASTPAGDATIVLAQHGPSQDDEAAPQGHPGSATEVDPAVAHGIEDATAEVFPAPATGPVGLLDVESRHEELVHAVHAKDPWYTAWFWPLRWAVYFAIWSALGLWYWRTSTRQDLTGDVQLTRRMEIIAAPGAILFGLTITFGAFDLLMALDPTWYSTMFGVYYFAGTAQATMAFLILTLLGLQKLGYLPSVTREHYHDLGKLMFTFVVFWAYVAFSQYMLIWYGAIPAEQAWMIVRGMSTNEAHYTPWNWVALTLLFGRFFIPFFGFMSRHSKRAVGTLAFWAVWLLVMHFIDVYWMVMPEYSVKFTENGNIPLPILALLCLVGIGGVFFAVATRLASRHALTPVGDPRLKESLAFHNV